MEEVVNNGGSNPGPLAIEECKVLDDCIGKMEHALDKHLDARLKTIEFQTAETLAKLTTLLDGLEQAANALKSHPLLGSLMSGDEDGFNFG